MPAGSAIVLNASLVSIKGNPAFSAYSATKAALRSFARNWAVDRKGKGIRVNAVSPGVIPTQGHHTSLGMTEQQVDDYIRSVTPAIPLGRTGTTDEVAKAVALLASVESIYITGSELFVDGGQAQI
jgi:NAD(P)-dependent dehydrogenase (short-subunit alcohol dehydrogenase family)